MNYLNTTIGDGGKTRMGGGKIRMRRLKDSGANVRHIIQKMLQIPSLPLEASEVKKLIDRLVKNPACPYAFSKAALTVKDKLVPIIKQRERIWHYALNINSQHPANIIVPDLFHQLKFNNFFMRTCVRKEDALYKQYLQKALLTFASEDDKSVADFLDALETARCWVKKMNAALNKKGRVLITTMHRAKGLEWDCVIVPCCWDSCMPMPNEDVDIESERRLFYVALTRARKQLYLVGENDTPLLKTYWESGDSELPTMRRSSQFLYEMGRAALPVKKGVDCK